MNDTYIDNYKNVIDTINKYRDIKQNEIRLVVVSKTQDYKKIIKLEEFGQKDFGENYLDEAQEKILKIKNPTIVWHYIGTIQSNKIRKICNYFHWVHTVSSEKHASKINDICRELGKRINICIQINIDNEKTKGGIMIDDFESFSSLIQGMSHLNLKGIMTIPDANKSCDDSFSRMKDLYNKYDYLDTLSMGMSKDYTVAIENDANLIRIGQQIFGTRK
tara:strand:- start:1346 stop:2002 length:657 start_codon:yes stop_codon:yes gene_type:complete